MPPWNRNARVVVPWASLIGQLGLEWSSVMARRKADGWKMLKPKLARAQKPDRRDIYDQAKGPLAPQDY